MSIIKKTSIALAMAAAFGLAAPAMAANITPAVTVANVSVSASGAVNLTGHNFAVAVNNDGSDLLLGRTTGFNLRFDLPAGVKFGATMIDVNLMLGTGAVSWNQPHITAGGAGANYVVINMAQNGAAAGLTADPFLIIKNLSLTGATALATDGAAITFAGQINDANTATTVNSFSADVVKAADPLKVTYDATDVDASNQLIDVGTGKVGFSANGSILDDDSNSLYSDTFQAGNMIIALAASSLLNATDGSAFVFNTADDAFVTTIAGNFGSAFKTGGGVFLSDDNDCGSSDVAGTVAADGLSATFAYNLDDLTGSNNTGAHTHVCLTANGSSVIVPTAIGASTTVTFDATGATSAADTGNLRAMAYNGSVAFVPVFNPGQNPTAQSFLRVINRSGTDGLVTVDGIDDDGNGGTSALTFMLEAGHSMQINSEDLESGNADKGLTGGLGDGAGKWRLQVTGEFNDMRVQSLNRNSTNGTVTNLSGEVLDSSGLINSTTDQAAQRVINQFFYGGGIP